MSDVAELNREADVMPKDWPVVAIGSLTRVKRGASPRPIQDPKWFSDEGHGWVRISDVTASDRVLLQTTQYLSDAGKAASVEIVPGDLIMSICGTIGRPLFSGIHACIHDGFVAFKEIDKSRLDPTYLYFTLQAQTRHFEAQSQPGTQRNLNSALVGKTEIPLPPLDEQRRIAEVLLSVDEAIAATLATNSQAQIALDSARAKLLTPSADTTALGDVCDVVGGYAFKSTSFVESGVKVLRISNITEGGVDFSGRAVCVAEQDVRGLDRFRLRPFDTVVALSGATTGKMCVFAFEEPVYANQRVAFIRVKEGLADQGYINHVLSMLTASVRQSAYGGAQPNISTKEIAAMEIALPRLTEQHEIAEVLDSLSQAVALGDQVLIAQQATKATLMSDLLSGRVRVPA